MCYEKNIRLWLINRKADARIDKTKIQDYKITSKAFAICCKFVGGDNFSSFVKKLLIFVY